MSRLSQSILDLLYPPKCAFCRRLVRDGRMLCTSCENTLPAPDRNHEIQYFPELSFCLSPLYYTGTVRDSLHRFKFHGAAAYYRIYAELMAACLQRHGVQPELITWVPISRKRLRRRGYDQDRLLAEEIARLLNIPCERMLEKIRHNAPQSGKKGIEERRENVQGVYRSTAPCFGEQILLVDDIVTTGSTLSAAAEVLKQAGAEKVIGLTLARALALDTGTEQEQI